MKRAKYIFLWENRSFVYDDKTKRITKCEPYSVPMSGSFAVKRVDGRMNLNSILVEALMFAKNEKDCVGFSVGYLDTNDPENKICQSIIKFTRI